MLPSCHKRFLLVCKASLNLQYRPVNRRYKINIHGVFEMLHPHDTNICVIRNPHRSTRIFNSCTLHKFWSINVVCSHMRKLYHSAKCGFVPTSVPVSYVDSDPQTFPLRCRRDGIFLSFVTSISPLNSHTKTYCIITATSANPPKHHVRPKGLAKVCFFLLLFLSCFLFSEVCCFPGPAWGESFSEWKHTNTHRFAHSLYNWSFPPFRTPSSPPPSQHITFCILQWQTTTIPILPHDFYKSFRHHLFLTLWYSRTILIPMHLLWTMTCPCSALRFCFCYNNQLFGSSLLP